MDHGFFEALTLQEAEAYLAAFKRAGRARVGEDWWSRLLHEGTESIRPYFAAVAGAVRVVRMPPPPGEPAYIVEAMERDHGGFQTFADDDSRVRVLAAAFFFGAAFIQSFPSLGWSIGSEDAADVGQPVVHGFRTGLYLPVLSVAENLLIGFDEQSVTVAVATWAAVV